MAMAQAARPLQLHTFGEANLDELAHVYERCAAAGVTVGAVWRAIVDHESGDGSALPLEHVFSRMLQAAAVPVPSEFDATLAVTPLVPPTARCVNGGALAAATEEDLQADEFDCCDDAEMIAAADAAMDAHEAGVADGADVMDVETDSMLNTSSR